jgi:hypothetical protein
MAQIIHDIDLPNSGNGDELRAAFGNQNTMNTELYTTKVDKVTGKDLSTNDFTNAEKAKLAGIEAGAQVNVPINWEDIIGAPEQLFSSVGFFDYSDLATQTTPLSISGGIATQITNDTDGAFTNVENNPYGVTSIWDAVNNEFDFSQLSIGDTIDIRFDFSVSSLSANQNFKIIFKGAVGSASEYELTLYDNDFKTSGAHPIVFQSSIYIGSQDMIDNPSRLFILTDANAYLKVNGFYTRIIRKSVNIIDISGGGEWGSITGDLSDQTDLQDALENKLDKVTTAGVERAYIINADGSQGIKATSYFGGGKRTQYLEFAINQNIVASANWYGLLLTSSNINTATYTATNASLTPTNNFANQAVQTPCKQVNFQCKIKNVKYRGCTNSGATSVRFCVVKSFRNSASLIANSDIIADKTFSLLTSISNENFTGADLDATVTIEDGAEIRVFIFNNNVNSNILSGILTVEVDEL